MTYARRFATLIPCCVCCAACGVACCAPVTAQDTRPAASRRQARTETEARAVVFERKLNLETYEKSYRPLREALIHKHAGKWVVIASGKLLPVRQRKKPFGGWAFYPGDDLEETIRAVNKLVPDARHRFVFRVGEDSDHVLDTGASMHKNLLGTGFMIALPGDSMLSGDALYAGWKGKPLTLKLEPGGRYLLKTRLSVPVGKTHAWQSMGVSSVYTGIGTVSSDLAEKLRLQLWEIPGKVTIKGALLQGELRRAQVRLGFKDTGYEMIATVAVWTR